jgi:NADPH:quinone reductase-like Zn-dependent oxidoreductase
MRALRLHAYGPPDHIHTDEVADPVPGSGEVLLDVAATSFNPSEVGLRRGFLRSIADVDLPYVLGWDVAGTVTALGPGVRSLAVGDRATALGPGVRSLAVGDRVIGRLDGGAAADRAVAPAAALVPAPVSIPLAHAAALPIAGLTAWQAVFEHGRVTAGQRVLVNGAGAIGRLAIQLARHAGARVSASASARSAAAAIRAGASLEKLPPGTVDVLLHFVPGPLGDAADLVRPGGMVVSATVPPDVATPPTVPPGVAIPAAPPTTLTDVAITPDVVIPATAPTAPTDAAGSPAAPGFVHFVARDDPAQLSELVSLVDAGVVTVDVTAIRPMTELAQVHAEAESGALPAGKTILVPGGVPG